MRAVQSPRYSLTPDRHATASTCSPRKSPARALASLAAALTGACLSLGAWAATPSYNPAHLGSAELSEVSEVCQSVMGFRPSAVLTHNLWTGDPDPATWTNDYRGCVATLSDSLQAVAAMRASLQAERDCLSKGLATSRSDLALCVLRAQQTPVRDAALLASSAGVPMVMPITPGARAQAAAGPPKEDLACAKIGLDPNEAGFTECVRGLKSVLSARFMQDLYNNAP